MSQSEQTTQKPQHYFSVLTYGCQMNENDSEKYADQLNKLGYFLTEDFKKASIILLNTCCIRESAEKKIHGKIGELKHLKRENPNLIIGIAGCMAQKDQDALLKKYSQLDFILGTNNIYDLDKVITNLIEKKKKKILLAQDEPNKEAEETKTLSHHHLNEGKVSTFVPIMYGCNNFCTYCIVPYVRGRERSRPIAEILKETEALGEKGYKEITLLGQNVNSYGKDKKDQPDFADLLKSVDNIKTIKRVRYMTSHPRDMNSKVIDTIVESIISGNKKLCENFHIPIQSGSNYILKKMNRGYTKEYYQELVQEIRTKVPDCSITTDLIVGFPGETEELFEETLEFMKKIRFDTAYTFIYSKRSNTPAASFDNQVPLIDKKRRLKILTDIQNEISLDINKKLENKVLEVLIEGESKNNSSTYTGRTRTNKIVLFERDEKYKPGQLIDVKITAAQTWVLKGQPI
ncbi:tRNA (N6-isopentenyl adenosine(37)-C2)-methylthiotransferase MiaB [Selenomonadales bacterium OttesenSCG-928-I06]|nr:tRNA (N6-isopentenyl adenosine(37)-C2)-methylthiotransferase MiaB [Selenomonadales bacterium OttesenSCG-928-I06]